MIQCRSYTEKTATREYAKTTEVVTTEKKGGNWWRKEAAP